MAKVNLLRPEIGGIKQGFLHRFSFGRLQKFLLLASGVCFLAGLLVVVHTLYQKKNLYYISSEYREAEKLKKEIGVMYQEKDDLDKELRLFADYLMRDVAWSQKLGQLRFIIPKDVWLRKLSFEQRQGRDREYSLILSGGLVPRSDSSPIAMLSGFINQLKENKEFFAGFDNPVLSDVRSETKENAEIMSFVIEMPTAKKTGKSAL